MEESVEDIVINEVEFRIEKEFDTNFRVSQKVDDDYRPWRIFCNIRFMDPEIFGRKGKKYWCVGSVKPEDYDDLMSRQKFTNRDDAIWHCYVILTDSKRIIEKCPLPNDVKEYLETRSRSLMEEEKNLRSEFLRARRERYQLLDLALKNRISNLYESTKQSDCVQQVKDLYTMEVTYPNPTKFGGNGDYIPEEKQDDDYITETFVNSLYTIFGKENARSIRAHLAGALREVAPDIVEEHS